MTPGGWLQIKAIVQDALDRAPEARAAFVDEACGADEALRREVESLLVAHERAGNFMDAPVLPAGAPIVDELFRGQVTATDFGAPPSAVTRQFSGFQAGGEFRGTDRFTVIRQLGAGGMGVVYAVHDRIRDEVVALKTLRHAGAGALYRLKHEFRRLADIAHPNLVCLYELIVEEGRCFFTMELIDGLILTEHARRVEGGAAARVRALLPQLVGGVLELHRHGKLHRDIKPSNIMVTAEGRVVILDFGLVSDAFASGAAITDRMAGTPAYLAPEQRLGRPPSEASDWYSLGVTLHEAVAGTRPSGTVGFDAPTDLREICVGLLHPDRESRLSGFGLLEILGRDGRSVAPSLPAPPPRRHQPVFFGRAPELAALAASFAAAERGDATAVYVHGPSGIGKTALIQRFLQPLERRDDVVVLRGRCYEHESVPHKALDGIIDSLTAHLGVMPAALVEELLPPSVGALSRAFPVMLQVDAVARASRPEAANLEPSVQRRRAVLALRQLLTRFAAHQTLVLHIDDLHWSDADSAALLEEVFKPPAPSRLLLLACFRSEEIPSKPFLQATVERRGSAAPVVVRLAGMDDAEARALIAQLLPRDAVPEHVARIERQAAGNPFLLEQLTHYAAAHDRELDHEPTLGDMLDEGLQRMPAGARPFLEVLAICGRPMEPRLVHTAAGLSGDERPLVALLRSSHFLRGSGAAAHVEMYHDRMRETLASGVPADAARRCHGVLAALLAARSVYEPEALFEHCRGAGEHAAAATHAAATARKAFATFAFDRAATFYRHALDLAPASAAGGEWREGLAEALKNAGRPADAAALYLEAARNASPERQIDLHRRAAEQLLIGGHIDRGLAVIDSVLRSVKMHLARGPLSAFASLSCRRAWLRWRGLAFAERAAADVPEQQLLRIDSCWSVTTGLSLVDSIRAADFNTRQLLMALDAGEPYRIARALALEGGFLATSGTDKRFATHCLEQGARLAERLGHPHALAVSDVASGMAAVLAADWRTAVGFFERALRVLREQCAGATWETNLAEGFLLGALLFLGEIREVSERMPALLVAAKDRGNLFFETELRTRMNLVWLAADLHDQGEREANDAMANWSQRGFHRQHYNHVLARVQTELYRGRAAAAWQLISSNWAAMARTRLLHIRFVKVEALYMRARSALLMAAARPDRDQFTRTAREDARRLKRVNMPWSRALALLIDAAADHLEGRDAAAAEHLTQAVDAFETVQMQLYVAVARRRLGELQQGDAGRRLKQQADEWMAAQGIKNAARMTRLIAPGFPDPDNHQT